ncbi:hypothetical protein [Mesobacillus jeotgali]|uniref:hypothetical protein n=1 Tax=Mesobacillus jeotgali TaxID=129985 RepID=UPI000C832C91|nr:hypothetical protein [Mesobacillus jeotgali]
MFIRKLVSALGATMMMVILFSILDESGVGLFLGMYILPIILIYGIPSSFLSDLLTRRTGGVKRLAAAGFLHVFLGALFVAVPTFIFDAENGNWINSVWNNSFFFFTAVVSSFIFWCFDEAIKSDWFDHLRGKCLGILKRIGDMRV